MCVAGNGVGSFAGVWGISEYLITVAAYCTFSSKKNSSPALEVTEMLCILRKQKSN